MQRVIVLLAMIFVAVSVQGATISTPASQDVRFSMPAVPSDLVIPPKVLSHPLAAYSDEARQLGIEGAVIVQAQFDEQGNFTVLKVAKGLGYGLDENALAALHHWHFSPALRNGLPVTAIAEIEVPFTLHNSVDELARRLQELERVKSEFDRIINFGNQLRLHN